MGALKLVSEQTAKQLQEQHLAWRDERHDICEVLTKELSSGQVKKLHALRKTPLDQAYKSIDSMRVEQHYKDWAKRYIQLYQWCVGTDNREVRVVYSAPKTELERMRERAKNGTRFQKNMIKNRNTSR